MSLCITVIIINFLMFLICLDKTVFAKSNTLETSESLTISFFPVLGQGNRQCAKIGITLKSLKSNWKVWVARIL